jgi:hypothetical protein
LKPLKFHQLLKSNLCLKLLSKTKFKPNKTKFKPNKITSKSKVKNKKAALSFMSTTEKRSNQTPKPKLRSAQDTPEAPKSLTKFHKLSQFHKSDLPIWDKNKIQSRKKFKLLEMWRKPKPWVTMLRALRWFNLLQVW